MLLSSSQSVPHKSDPALRSMFEARKKVFVDLLKWDLPVLDGRFEVDQFDTPEAVYLVLTDESANHRASARLLRTDRSHILALLWQIYNFWDSHLLILVIHKEPAIMEAGDGWGLAERS